MQKLLFLCLAFFSFVCVRGQVNLQWAKTMAGAASSYNEGKAVVVDGDGNVYSCGGFTGSGDFNPNAGTQMLTASTVGMYGMYIQKLDSAGNFLWAKQLGGNSLAMIEAIAVDNQGNVYATGQFTGTVDFDPSAAVYNLSSPNPTSLSCKLYHVFICKLDAAGNFLWAKHFESANNTACNGGVYNATKALAIAVDAFGYVYTTGCFGDTTDFDPSLNSFTLYPAVYPSSGNNYTTSDMFISKLDANGNFVWAKQIGSGSNNAGANYEVGKILKIDVHNNLYIGGTIQGQTPVDFDPGVGGAYLTSSCPGGLGYNSFIMKLDSLGDFVWANLIRSNNSVELNSFQVNLSGDVYFSGTFSMQAPVDLDPSTLNYMLTTNTNGYADFVAKWTSAGVFAWAKQIAPIGTINPSASAKTVVVNALDLDGNSNLYLTGYFLDSVDFDPNSTLHLLRSKPGLSVFNDTIFTKDIFLLRLDSMGNFKWVKQISQNAYNDKNEEAQAIFLDKNHDIFLTGWYQDTTDFDPAFPVYSLSNGGFTNIFVAKLRQCKVIHTIEASTCDAYTLNNQTYTTSGIYQQFFNQGKGCDSVVKLILTIAQLQAAINQNGNMLTASPNGLTYQWLDCSNNSLIAGATNASFSPMNNGQYAAIVYQNACADTTDCVMLSGLAISENKGVSQLRISPNPITKDVHLLLEKTLIKGNISIFNAKGQLVWEQKQLLEEEIWIDFSTQASGIYYLVLRTDEEVLSLKFIK